MKKITEISLTPAEAAENDKLKHIVAKKTYIPESSITGVRVLKRSIDARQKKIVIRHLVEVWIDEAPFEENPYVFRYQNVSRSPSVIIAGAGPAGLFAALRLIELGIKPVIIDRGKRVEDRKHDIAAINKNRIINSDSNYCYGEGGAGTYSDGKLYTRSVKKGDVKRILNIFHRHGATADILTDSHPHIGTDKLPKIIYEIRNTILNNGGEFYFGQRITKLIILNGHAKGVITKNGDKFEGKAVILATGHSARDIVEMLMKENISTEAKPFAVGVRIEHPQQLIDSVFYHTQARDLLLPAASYSLAERVGGKGVFSFCMCPGGTIVTASASQGELVLNGMSASGRNLPYANSGMVVSVDENDFTELKKIGTLAGIKFQEDMERSAFIAGGSNLTAPAQNMLDFTENKISVKLNGTSYFPGIKSAPLHEILPAFIVSRMQEAFRIFDRKMKGFLTNEATLLGVETRTSSPVRIPRNPVTLENIQIGGLYPCGEGAGFSGGIVSSAVDGERCAEAVSGNL